jgi:hypothetical protein
MWIFVVLILIMVVYFLLFPTVEHAATSPGTLVQLNAVGPQDRYLMTGYDATPYYYKDVYVGQDESPFDPFAPIA